MMTTVPQTLIWLFYRRLMCFYVWVFEQWMRPFKVLGIIFPSCGWNKVMREKPLVYAMCGRSWPLLLRKSINMILSTCATNQWLKPSPININSWNCSIQIHKFFRLHRLCFIVWLWLQFKYTQSLFLSDPLILRGKLMWPSMYWGSARSVLH